MAGGGVERAWAMLEADRFPIGMLEAGVVAGAVLVGLYMFRVAFEEDFGL